MMIGGAAAGSPAIGSAAAARCSASMALFGICTLVVSVVLERRCARGLRFARRDRAGRRDAQRRGARSGVRAARQRALAVTLTIVCVPLGGTLAGLIAIPALPAFGWRALFVTAGIVPIVAALALLRVLPESPRYLAARPARWNELRALLARMGHPLPNDTTFEYRRHLVTARATFGDLFTAAFRRDTLSLWLAFFTCLLAVYLGFSWLPSILSGAGLGAAVASTGITVFNLGGVAGAIGGGLLIGAVRLARDDAHDYRRRRCRRARAERHGDHGGRSVHADHRPSRLHRRHDQRRADDDVRARGARLPDRDAGHWCGTAVSIGRAGAVLSGYAGPWALGYGGSTSFFRLMAAALCVTLLALAAVQRHVPRERSAPPPNRTLNPEP